jgi:bile acid:Na+ symporter, BASS family
MPLTRWVPVEAGALLVSIVQIVLVPVVVGVATHHLFPRAVRRLQRLTPLLSVLVIVVLVAGIVAHSAPRLVELAPALLLAVAAHNAAGLGLGYGAGAALGLAPAGRRTVALEVGMQNSGLAVALAVTHLGPAAALAGALFSVWHNLTGPALASLWSRR